MIQRPLLLFCSALLASTAIAVAQTPAAPGVGTGNPSTARAPQPPAVSSAQPGPAPAAPSLTAVPENTPVITINGVCGVSLNGTVRSQTRPTAKAAAAGTAASSAADCKTQVTRAEFEHLTKTVAAAAPATVYRQIASRYVQVLTAANEGVKLGVEKDPEFSDQLNEQLALVRLQMLAQYAERKLQAEASNVSEAEEKAYYDQNSSAFEQVTLTRIFVPRSSPAPNTATQPGAPPAAADSDAVAESARKQLAAGDDPEKIQKSVYEQLKNSTSPPTTSFGTRRRGALPPAQEQKVFALNPHDVSEVMSDSIGHVIYRLDSKQVLPFDQVKDEIKRKITQQRLEDSRQKIMSASKTDYNDAYFGPEAAAPRAGPAGAPPAASSAPLPRPAAPSAPAATSQSSNPK